MKIHIHVGVHKTATTYIQNMFHANRAVLNEAGIGYLSLWELRSFLTEKLMSFTPQNFRIEDHLPRFFNNNVPGQIRGLLISEENFIGHCGGLVNSGEPFANAGGRLAQLRKLLPGHDITMFCALRDYHTFLSSAYCEGIRNKQKFVTFETFRSRLRWDKMNWPELLAKFEQNLRPTKTILWRYEDFRKHSKEILNALCFDAGLTLAPPTGADAEYPSFSQTTIDTLEVLAKNLEPEIANALINSIGKTFPKGDSFKAFEPWGKNEIALMQRLYREDCQMIDQDKFLIAPVFSDAVA
jgi:hypothetical protein